MTPEAAVAANRRIGQIGAAARVAGAAAAIGAAIGLEGVSAWDLFAGLLALPLTAIVTGAAVTASLRRRSDARAVRSETKSWVRSLVVLGTVVAVEVGATFVTPLDGASALLIFIGVSLLVATIRDDAGCEAVAIPNALTGRRDSTGCVLYAPIDAIESGRSPTPTKAKEVRG
jgi:hypothetical protein